MEVASEACRHLHGLNNSFSAAICSAHRNFNIVLAFRIRTLFVASGGMINIRWAHNGIVTTGFYCTAQGLVEQIGDLGVALIFLVCLLS
jgi:hypothetical protein